MDVILAEKLLHLGDDATKEGTTATLGPSYVGILLGIVIGVYAIYVSWTCNSASGISVPLKVFYAFFAYVFGLLYLILHFIFVGGRCFQFPSV